MESGTTTHFERERSRLIGEIAENLAKCVTSVNALNRNIENVVSVGVGFEPVNHLWTQFERVIASGRSGGLDNGSLRTAGTDQGNEISRDPILQPHYPIGTDQNDLLPPGLAPGQGETALFSSTTASKE